MAPWYNYSWRDWRAPPWEVPVKTTLIAAERAYIWRMHLHTPRYMRAELHAQLAVRYNCALRLVTECVAEQARGRSPSPPAPPQNRGRAKTKGKSRGKGKARALRLIAGPSVAVGEDVQGREVEMAEAEELPEAGPSRPRGQRRSSAVYIEVSTVAEVRAMYRASSSRSGEATSSGGDSSGSLRRSTRTHQQAEPSSAPASPFLQAPGAAEVPTSSSHSDPYSVAPDTTGSSKAPSMPAPEECGGFRAFLEGLGLERTVPIFAAYGFRTAQDAKLLEEMSLHTRKQLFEWLVEDGKVNLKELTVLHEHLIAKK